MESGGRDRESFSDNHALRLVPRSSVTYGRTLAALASGLEEVTASQGRPRTPITCVPLWGEPLSPWEEPRSQVFRDPAKLSVLPTHRGQVWVRGRTQGQVAQLRKKLGNVGDLMESEAKLQSQLLDLLDTIQSTYKTRYLQAFDEVTGKCEQVRTEIDSLPDCDKFQAIAELVKIEALGSVDVAALMDEVNGYKDSLFESALDRNGVDAGLKHRPQPEGCMLHIDEADSLVAAAEQALEQA